jgi:hypothetical protein
MEVREITALNNTMHNHIDGCLQLHSKKLLFKNFYSYLKKYGMFYSEKIGILSSLSPLLIIFRRMITKLSIKS